MNKEKIEEILRRDAESMRSHNFSETYIETTTENTSKWVSIGLLDNVESPYVIRQMATLLENQRLFNQNYSAEQVQLPKDSTMSMDIDKWVAQFKRISIPAVRRIFAPEGFVGYDLVSVQTMLGPSDDIYFTNSYDRQIAETISAKTSKLRTRWDDYVGEIYTERTASQQLDHETEVVAKFSKSVQNEINHEIVRDLRANAGKNFKESWQGPEKVLEWIDSLSSYIATKTGGREGTWLVMGSNVVDALSELDEITLESRSVDGNIQRVGKLAKPNGSYWDLFEMNLYHPNQVLIGHKNPGNHYASGYFYAPYAPLSCVPSWWNENTHGHGYTLLRYGKKMMRDGANYYALMEVNDIPVKQDEAETETETEIESESEEANDGVYLLDKTHSI